MIDAHNNTSLLQLPLDRLLQQAAAGTAAPPAAGSAPAVPAAPDTTPASGTVDVRSRENQRGRDRDSR
jgi:membrane protease subunit HflK